MAAEKSTPIVPKTVDVEGWQGRTVLAYPQGAPSTVFSKPSKECMGTFNPQLRGFDELAPFPLSFELPAKVDEKHEAVQAKCAVLHHEHRNRTADSFFHKEEENVIATRHSGGFTWFALDVAGQGASQALKLTKIKDVVNIRKTSSNVVAKSELSATASERLQQKSALFDLFSTEEDLLYRAIEDTEEEEVVLKEGTEEPSKKEPGEEEGIQPQDGSESRSGSEGMGSSSDSEGSGSDEDERRRRLTGKKRTETERSPPERQAKRQRQEEGKQQSATNKVGAPPNGSGEFPAPDVPPAAPADLMTVCQSIVKKYSGKAMEKDRAVKTALKNCRDFEERQRDPPDVRQGWYRVSYSAALKCFKDLGCSFEQNELIFPRKK